MPPVQVSPYGLSPYGLTPYGSPPGPFGVQGATAIMPVILQVRFNDILDLTNPALTQVSSYTLSPSVTIYSATIETAGSVRLITDYLSAPTYTVTVAGPTSYFGHAIHPDYDSATFPGFPAILGFQPVGVSPRKVRILFEDYMQVDAALTDPASYTVLTPQGTAVPIAAVIAEGPPTAPVAVALVLGTDLVPRGVHTAVVTDAVRTHEGYEINPKVKNFRWVPRVRSVAVPMREFSGETHAGLLGETHAGLVFFSPSLAVAAPNSAIQVEEVSVCTRAHDVYQMPNPPDPAVLFTFKRGIQAGTLSTPGRVSFATFDKLGGAKVELGDLRRETLAAPVDSHCVYTLTETLDPARAPRLNAIIRDEDHRTPPWLPRWPLFDGVSATPFTTAANLIPIPPGTTTTDTLQP